MDRLSSGRVLQCGQERDHIARDALPILPTAGRQRHCLAYTAGSIGTSLNVVSTNCQLDPLWIVLI